MSAVLRIAALARADFLERSRRYSFLLTLGFVLYAAYLFLPPNHAGYTTLQMGGHRGIYNSAWVGTLVAIHTALFLSLFGFYLVKNTLQRDRDTGVGRLLASCPLSNRSYIAAKVTSNFFMLSTMVIVMTIAAAAMQLVRHEDTSLRPLVLAAPFLLLTLPAMLFVSAVAVLFETVGKLRGGLGNVVYYFAWTALLATGLSRQGQGTFLTDLVGAGAAVPDMLAACARAFPDFDPQGGSFSMGFHIRANGESWELSTFAWEGVRWTLPLVLSRLLWAGAAVVVGALAARLFDRFDPARNPRSATPAPLEESVSEEPETAGPIETSGAGYAQAKEADRRNFGSWSSLAEPESAGAASRFVRLVHAEWRLALRGVSLWWWVVTAANVAGCMFAPMEIARAYLFPFAWIWPLLIWSGLGTRETRWGTEALFHSSPGPLSVQLPAAWIAGVLVAMAAGAGMALRFLVTGETASLVAWLAGAGFVPALALALGSASGQSKLFEIVYLIGWYMGPLNKFPYVDFMAVTPGQSGVVTSAYVGALAVVCLCAAFAARFARLRR